MNAVALAAFCGAAVSALLALLRVLTTKRSLAHWMFACGFAALAVESLYSGLAAEAGSLGAFEGMQRQRLLWLSASPGIWLLFSLSYARGNSRNLLGKWRWYSLAVVFLPLAFALAFRDSLLRFVPLQAPAWRYTIALGWAGLVEYVYTLVVSVLVVMSLERTFRAAIGTIRWRIKFMLFGVGLLFVVRVYTSTQILLFRGFEPQLEVLNSAALVVGALLITRSFFRNRDFEVDVYPSHSVLQGSITIILAGIYLVLVGILARITTYLGGDNEFALKAFLVLVSIVALAVFLQSDRVRLRLGQFVSRNFQRPLYDYRTVWRKFTEGTTSRVEKGDLCRALVKLMVDTFQTLSVAIWIIDEKGEAMELAASTFLPEGKGRALQLKQPEAGELIARFQEHAEPMDFEELDGRWAPALRELHVSRFPNGGHRVCVPLVSQGEVIGALTMGDRVGGVAYTLQDFDMLKCVADDAAAGLRNVQLSQKLLQGKELEAFQTMAAFFVHDLKNAASTLNLMLQNLPEHFDDPAFRADSLRGVSKTVDHINALIGRLSLLRNEQAIRPTESDLNEVVGAALAGLEQGVGAVLSKDLRPVPKLLLDREQIFKVVTNLVLNAAEAVAADGSVRVETRAEAAWVVLSVTDNGCGMSPEFLAKGLFRPFQTTKKNGIGIGMFQSKMIVEGHGGRITVASEPGKGTTFQVLLPIKRPL